MVVFNYSGAEINAKVVYYGPALSGKTTNLEYIYKKMPANSKGKMVSMKTRTDRTLFFDFLPLELGEINGYRTRILLYTVPGQVYYNATRKLVLKGADAVVFVADSSEAKMQENIDSLSNLEENLNEHGLTLDTIPWAIQYNKRDLPDALPTNVLAEKLNLLNVPSFEAIATTGEGIYETFQAIAGLLYAQLVERLRNVQPAVRSTAKPGPPPPPPPPVQAPESQAKPPVEPLASLKDASSDDDSSMSEVVEVALREVDESADPVEPADEPRKKTGRRTRGRSTADPASPPPPPNAGISASSDFELPEVDAERVDDEDVGRVIDFEETESSPEPEPAKGEFIVDPFQSSKSAEEKAEPPSAKTPLQSSKSAEEGDEPPPAKRPLQSSKSAGERDEPPPAKTPLRSSKSPEKKPEPPPTKTPPPPPPPPVSHKPREAAKEAAPKRPHPEHVTVSIPVVLTRSQLGKTIPIKLELEIEVTDEEA